MYSETRPGGYNRLTIEDAIKLNVKSGVDGCEDTRWGSLYSDDQWLTVDLGSSFLVDRIRLIWETAYGMAYKIQISTDNKKWKTIIMEDYGDGGIDDFSITPILARYVKICGIKRGTQWGYSLFEFQIHKKD
jgi:endo-1,3(4)-beta-glucanase